MKTLPVQSFGLSIMSALPRPHLLWVLTRKTGIPVATERYGDFCCHRAILNQVMSHRLVLLAVDNRERTSVTGQQHAGEDPFLLQLIQGLYHSTGCLVPVIHRGRSHREAILRHLLYLTVERLMEIVLRIFHLGNTYSLNCLLKILRMRFTDSQFPTPLNREFFLINCLYSLSVKSL